jgi:hypothetical protein
MMKLETEEGHHAWSQQTLGLCEGHSSCENTSCGEWDIRCCGNGCLQSCSRKSVRFTRICVQIGIYFLIIPFLNYNIPFSNLNIPVSNLNIQFLILKYWSKPTHLK